MGPVVDEVIGSDMVRLFGTQPDAGAVVQLQAPSLRLTDRHLQPLAPPQPLILLFELLVPAELITTTQLFPVRPFLWLIRGDYRPWRGRLSDSFRLPSRSVGLDRA